MKPILKAMKIDQERGAALVLAVMAAVIMIVLGGAFALLVKNEVSSVGRGTAYEQALYVAESGVEDILFQRSKNQSDNCAPYDDDGTLTGAAGQVNGPAASCDTDTNTDADPADPDKDYLPCWPYNEKLYANKYSFGPNFYCNDGSDPVNCPSYKPLAVWPAGPAPGQTGWKDMNPNKPVPLPNAAASSGQRFTTGFFTVCNDDFAGDDLTVEPAKSHQGCLTPPCNRAVMFLSIVSVGEVETRPGETVRRAVKVDILPVGLYTGVIDQFVDLTGTIQVDVNGPVHINGWWDQKTGNSTAFLLSSSFALSALLTIFDPPEMVSVSYPEDPANPDWQPPLGLSHITYVHLPMRLDIPQPNWDQFEDRMNKLYADALGLYSSNQVHKVKRGDYDPGNMYNPNGDGSTDFGYYMAGMPVSFCDAGKSNASIIVGDGGFSGCRDSEDLMTLKCFGPWADPQCCAPNGPAGGRIHNCNRDNPAVWKNVAIDLYDFNTGSYVSGTEMASLGGGSGPRDKSLRYVPTVIYDLHLSGGGCGFSNIGACLSRTVNKPEFKFMGKHEYQGKIFIDGTMGIGSRTPFHTCGEGDGSLTFYCLIIPPLDLGFATIPSWHFGVPHWHLGAARIKGEMLVNGKLFMADYVSIDGGAVYADDHVIKDETSALDIMLNISKLLKSLIKLIFPALAVFPASLIFDLAWGFIDIVFQLLFPWWPVIDLTNNAFLDFEVYLDINGWNTSHVVNSGTLYTRGDFRYENPDPDMGMSILNVILNLFTSVGDFGIEFVPAVDPIRIWNYGAVIAAGKEITGAPGMYQDGNIYLAYNRRLDVLVGDPANPDNTIPENTAYMFARNSLQISSDLISHYSGAGLFDNCNSWLGVDADCAAQGIFYSGGLTADANPHNQLSMFTTRGGGTAYEDVGNNIQEKKYHPSCIPFDDPDFFGDALANLDCWAKNAPLFCTATGYVLGGTCDPSEIDISGYIFAGKVGGMPNSYFRLDQNPDTLMKAVERRYYGNLTSTPMDWMEIHPPVNLGRLN